MTKPGFLFAIFTLAISCNSNERKNSAQKKDCVIAIDTLLPFKKILKNVTDTLPDFKPGKILLVYDQSKDIHAKCEDSSYSLSAIYFPDGRFEGIDLTYQKQNLQAESDFYYDGKLRCKGILIPNTSTLIGKWNYYSEKGKLDSVVDYDKKLKVNYIDAIRIAEKRGWNKNDFTVYVINYTKGISWEIIHAEKPAGDKDPLWSILEISSITGKQKILRTKYLITTSD
jgi:hypothetical protein